MLYSSVDVCVHVHVHTNVRMTHFSSHDKSLQISSVSMHTCTETIYKALCNLPFQSVLGFICRGLSYHIFCGIHKRRRDIQNVRKRKTNFSVISGEKGQQSEGVPRTLHLFLARKSHNPSCLMSQS